MSRPLTPKQFNECVNRIPLRGIELVLIFLVTTSLVSDSALAVGPSLKGNANISLSKTTNNQNQVTYTLTGNNLSFLVWNTPVQTFDVGLLPFALDGQQQRWGNPIVWDSPALAFINTANIVETVDGVVTTFPTVLFEQEDIKALQFLGPTEQTLTVTPYKIRFPYEPELADISLSVGVPVRFNVTLASGANINQDQSPVTLESLTVASGANLAADSITTHHALNNAGSITNLSATVQGDFTNSGSATIRSLSVQGAFSNTGTLTFPVNASFYRSQATSNNGTLMLAGVAPNALNFSVGLTDYGSIRGYGSIGFNIDEYGTLNADATGQGLVVGGNGWSPIINNHGVIMASNGGTLFLQNVTINQDAGTAITANGGSVELSTASINGGSLNGTGPFNVTYIATFNNVINNASLQVNTYNYLSWGLYITGGSFINNGSVNVNYRASSGASSLQFQQATSLTGNGIIQLNGGIAWAPSKLLTVSSSQSIQGWGTIGADLDFSSTLSANVSGKTLDVGASIQGEGSAPKITNHGTLTATNGGKLAFHNATITQDTGTITNNGGVLTLDGVTITGGSLGGSSPFTVSSAATLRSVSNNAEIDVGLAPNGYPVTLDLAIGASITGSGSILVNAGTLQGGDLTTSIAGQTIHGWGIVNASASLYGTINADVSGQALTIGTNGVSSIINNHGVIMASNGGTLSLQSTTINQDAGTAITANGGSVELSTAGINGGSLNGTGPFNVTYISTFNNVINNASLQVNTYNYLSWGLYITGGSFINNGSVNVNYRASSGASSLQFQQATSLTGNGIIQLNGGIAWAPSKLLTVSSSQSIQGWGTIGADLDFSSTLSANVSGKTLDVGASIQGEGSAPKITNHGTLTATNGGKLAFHNATITQDTGTITNNGGALTLDGVTITGGSLGGTSPFTVSSAATLRSVSNNAEIDVGLAPNGYPVTLDLAIGASITGSGSIFLKGGTLQGGDPTTSIAGQTIHGWGIVNASASLYGIINADASGQALTIGTNGVSSIINNHGVIMASNSGTLSLQSATINQDPSAVITANAGIVSFQGFPVATVNGGLLNSLNGGYLAVSNGVTLQGVTNNGVLRVLSSSGTNQLFVTGGALANNGSIPVNYGGTGGAQVYFQKATTVTGTGEIILVGSGSSIQGAPLTNAFGHGLRGDGMVVPALVNAGTINPGTGVGTMNFSSSVTLQSTSLVRFELAGTTQGSTFDYMNVTGALNLGGKLEVVVLAPFQGTLKSTDSFRIIRAGSVTGAFSNVASGGLLQTNFGTCVVTVDSTGVTLSNFLSGQSWKDKNFTVSEQLNSAVSGDLADPNHNGIPNLLEYAMDGDPKGTSTTRPTVSNGPGYVSINYRRSNSASDVTITVQESLNMVNWTTALVSEEILSDDGNAQMVKAKVGLGSETKKFLRLQVTRP